ncbi:MAG: GSCFA domain-containing protein, partial [Bacteroidota bacterium]
KESLREFKDEVERGKASLNEALLSSDFLFITLGTSIVFKWNVSNEVANNCHRLPSTHFEKRMLSEQEMVTSLKNTFARLISKNPNVQIVLTVSPIRHLRHGAIQNQRSKARLIRTCEIIESNFTNCSYLPIYELVMDELRDYRFYRQDDLIHLNDGGLEIIKDRFSTNLMDSKCFPLMRKVESWKKAFHHRVQNPNGAEAAKFREDLHRKTEELNILLKGRFNNELKQLRAS